MNPLARTLQFAAKCFGIYPTYNEETTLENIHTLLACSTLLAALKINPNSDFEVEALHARYSKLAAPKARPNTRCCCGTAAAWWG